MFNTNTLRQLKLPKQIDLQSMQIKCSINNKVWLNFEEADSAFLFIARKSAFNQQNMRSSLKHYKSFAISTSFNFAVFCKNIQNNLNLIWPIKLSKKLSLLLLCRIKRSQLMIHKRVFCLFPNLFLFGDFMCWIISKEGPAMSTRWVSNTWNNIKIVII